MPRQELSISVVVPAYNEQDYIGACLDALSEQTRRPLEIIVVDNASDDSTAEIASSFPGVRVVTEPTQAIYAAVTTGFNAARGTIIARTDADCRPDKDWLENIEKAFSCSDADAFSGPIYYYDMPAASFIRRAEKFVRSRLSNHCDDAKFLTGANMAIRRQAWRAVQSAVCRRQGIHEDLDLAIHLQKNGAKIGFSNEINIATSARRIAVRFTDFYRYISGYESIYLEHGIKRKFILKVPLLCYVPLQPLGRLIFKAYNSNLNQLALDKLSKLLESGSNY